MEGKLINYTTNTLLARCDILKVQDKAVVIRNSGVEFLSDMTLKLRLECPKESIDCLVSPIKLTKTLAVLLMSDEKERRSYERVPCDIPAVLFIGGREIDAHINEISYAACIVNVPEQLFCEEEVNVKIARGGYSAAPSGEIYCIKGDTDNAWFEGYTYVVKFHELKSSYERAELYSIIRNERMNAL